MSNKIKEELKSLKKKLDTNGDGVIQSNELLNPNNIKIILVTILALLLPESITWVQLCIEEGSFQSNGMFDLLQIVIVPFILIYFFKSVLEDYQGKLKGKDDEIKELENSLISQKAARQQDASKAEIELLQLEGALTAKDMEISWIREKYPLNE